MLFIYFCTEKLFFHIIIFMVSTSDYVVSALRLIGSIGLLLFGMKMMSEALQKLAGSGLRHILAKMTSNRLSGILTGMTVTAAVQSSSATTVMTVSFVSAGFLTLSQAISVIMGANIGTTLTAWIMSLGYNVDLTDFVFAAFTLGIAFIYRRRYRYVGDLLFGLAFMLLSLVALSQTGKSMDLAHNESVVSFFASFETDSYPAVIIVLIIGTLITCIVQSSAAVMAITILLCSTGVLPIYLGIALVMGENIGTTATANLAAMGSGTNARRAALAHLLFNVFGVIWILCVFYPFVDVVCELAGYDPQAGGQSAQLPIVLAMFHTCFNVTNTLLLVGFVPHIERLVCRLIPVREQQSTSEPHLKYIDLGLIRTPEIAVLQAQKETGEYGLHVNMMFDSARRLFSTTSEKTFTELFDLIENKEDLSDKVEIEIARYLEKVGAGHLSDDTKQKIHQMMRVISELESIGDACHNLARICYRRRQTNLPLTNEQVSNLESMMTLCGDALSLMCEMLNGHIEDYDIQRSYEKENEINLMRTRLKSENIDNINAHRYNYQQATIYVDYINELEKLGDYIINVVEARFGK